MRIPLDWLSHAALLAARARHPVRLQITEVGIVALGAARTEPDSPPAGAAEELTWQQLAGSQFSPLPELINRVVDRIDKRLASKS